MEDLPPDLPSDPFADDADDAAERPLSRRERAAVLARIQSLIEFWGITPEELEAPTPEPERPPGPLPIKYRHPVSGETWDGAGPHPEWLRHALLKEGLRVDELKPTAGSLSTPPPDTDPA